MDYNTRANSILFSNDYSDCIGRTIYIGKKIYHCKKCGCEVDYYQVLCYECEHLDLLMSENDGED